MRWERRGGGRSRLVGRGRLLKVRRFGVARKHGRTNGELVGDGRTVTGISCRRQFAGGLLISGVTMVNDLRTSGSDGQRRFCSGSSNVF